MLIDKKIDNYDNILVNSQYIYTEKCQKRKRNSENSNYLID